MTTEPLGYRMPAEWEPHEAVWLGWPHNSSDWPGTIAAIHFVYAEIVRRIAEIAIVRIFVSAERLEAKARTVLQTCGFAPDRLDFFRIPSTRV